MFDIFDRCAMIADGVVEQSGEFQGQLHDQCDMHDILRTRQAVRERCSCTDFTPDILSPCAYQLCNHLSTLTTHPTQERVCESKSKLTLGHARCDLIKDLLRFEGVLEMQC